MRRQALIAWPTKIVPAGGVYDECIENGWKGVTLRSIALGENSHLFSRDVELQIGDASPLALQVKDGNGNGHISLVDVPYKDLTVAKGAVVRFRMKNDGGLDGKVQVVAILWVDDEDESDGQYRHAYYESGPAVVQPGGSATLVVAPAEELPFRTTFFHLTGGAELVVTSLRVGPYDQLVVPEAPGTMFRESEDMQISVVLTKQQVTLTVENRRPWPVTANFKLEGVNIANMPVTKIDAQARYGKLGVTPAQPSTTVYDDDDDDDDFDDLEGDDE